MKSLAKMLMLMLVVVVSVVSSAYAVDVEFVLGADGPGQFAKPLDVIT